MHFTIESEHEEQGAWTFDVRLQPGEGPVTRSVLRLSWRDYDHWCRGSTSPAEVAQAVMAYLMQRQSSQEIGARLDASTIRRRYPEIDQELWSHAPDGPPD